MSMFFDGEEIKDLPLRTNIVQGEAGPTGNQGERGEKGDQGENGVGVITGGSLGQVLAKKSNDDYDTEWIDQSGGTGVVTWGAITGLLSNQIDLQNALDLKAPSTNIPASSITGLAIVATSGSYNDLSNKPSIPNAQVNSDWEAISGISQILNKPDLAIVATSGSYNDLIDKPAIPSGQVNSDWSSVTGVSQILNKPNLAVVATSGSYTDLSNKPTYSDVGAAPASGISPSAISGNAVITTDPRLSDSRTPTGVASGDLSGFFPNPTVDGLQGFPISVATPYNGQVLQYNGESWVPGSIPNGGSGGGGVVYFLNFNTPADIPVTNIPQTPNASKELSIEVDATATSYQSPNLSTDNYDFLASFVTDLNVPSSTAIPAGIWDFNTFVEGTSTNAANQIYFKIEILKYDGVNAPTLLASSNDTYIFDPTEITQYVTSLIMPQTTILSTDRIVVYIYGRSHQNGKTLTFHFGGQYPSHTHSTIPSVTGSGIVKVVNGVIQSPASTIVNADVSETANIAQTKIANLTTDLTGKVSRSGDTMTGKLNLPASTTASAPINIPHGVDPASLTNGDIWLNGSIRYRDQAGNTRFVADLNRPNSFTQRQTIAADSFTTNPALKITQLGSGEALRVEDESPESTPFVVSASGRVGIGTPPDASVALKVDATGIKFSDNTVQTTAAISGVTSFSAGTTGLTPSTTTVGEVTLSGTLAIANGGTGSTTSANALTALGAVAKSGDTMTGKLIVAADDTASKLNIGVIVGTSPTTAANGDLWITGGNRFAWRSGGTSYNSAATNLPNTFNSIQTVDTSNSFPALRVTQRGTGEALRVEDETTPDATAFVVSNTGRVGIGVTPDAAVSLSVDTTGIKFGDGTIQTTAAVSGVTSVSGTSPILSSGGATPIISIAAASTVSAGAVQLEDSVSSTSTTKAAVPNSVKTAYDLASGKVAKSGDTMTGKLNLPASTITEAGLNIGNGANPTSPVTGDTWISTADNLLKWRTASATISVAASNLANSFSANQTIQTSTSSTVPALRVTQRGTGEALRVEDDTTPDSTAFVISSDGRVGIGVTPDASVALSLDSTGVKFNDGTIQTTAAVSGVTSVSGTSPILSSGGATPIISIAAASTISSGVVILEDSVSSTSTTKAAVPNSVKTAYDLASGALQLSGGSYVIAKSGDDIAAKYAAAKALTPNGSALSSTNRASLIILPSSYTLSSELAIDAEFVDVIGLGAQTQKPVVFISGNTLNVSANNVRIIGISVGTQAFKISSDKPLQVFENCVGGNNSFGGADDTASGTFTNCVGGSDCFAGNGGIAGGTFTNCMGGLDSFGGEGITNGIFINCTITVGTFNVLSAPASGTARMINCIDANGDLINGQQPL